MVKYFLVLFLIFLGGKANAGGFAVSVNSMVSATATTASTLVSAADPYRNYLLIQNNGTDSVILTFGKASVSSIGIIVPAGGNYEPIKGITNSVYAQSVSGSQPLVILCGY